MLRDRGAVRRYAYNKLRTETRGRFQDVMRKLPSPIRSLGVISGCLQCYSTGSVG